MKERLLQFIDYMGISQRAFCRKIGMSENWVTTMRSTCRNDTISKIGECYPNLNLEWLISGNGEMLMSKSLQSINEIDRLLDLLEEKDKQIREKDKQINSLIELIKAFGNK